MAFWREIGNIHPLDARPEPQRTQKVKQVALRVFIVTFSNAMPQCVQLFIQAPTRLRCFARVVSEAVAVL